MVIHGFRNQQNVPAKNYNCNASLLPGAKLTFAALWSIALGKTKLAGLTGGAH
jgi:hypothetical protein